MYNNNYYNTITFGQLYPLKPVLKIATGINNVNDSRLVCTSHSDKFVGNVGYYKKSLAIVNAIIEKDKNLADFITTLKDATKECKLNKINEFTSTKEFIDIVI